MLKDFFAFKLRVLLVAIAENLVRKSGQEQIRINLRKLTG